MKGKGLLLLCFGTVSWYDFSRQSIPRKMFRINNDWGIIGKMKCTPEKQIILFSCSAPQEQISCRKDFRKHIAYVSHLISSCFPLTSDLGPCLWQWFCYISCLLSWWEVSINLVLFVIFIVYMYCSIVLYSLVIVCGFFPWIHRYLMLPETNISLE